MNMPRFLRPIQPALLCILLCSFSALAQSAEAPRPKTRANSIGMTFALIPAGSFTRAGGRSVVSVSKDFYLGVCEVTQEQWAAVMGSNPSAFPGRTRPVEMVSWDDAQKFIKALNAREKHSRYRLPTEAEWELAARGGTDAPLFFLKERLTHAEWLAALDAHVWFGGNSGGATHPVGQKQANLYGLHDIYGNVWEWMQDWYQELPEDREIRDYLGTADDNLHVTRGGCWVCAPALFQAGSRGHGFADRRSGHVGFRLAFSAE